jgi:S-formylglutathione hydrolase FrmB
LHRRNPAILTIHGKRNAMALVHCDFKSEALAMGTSLRAILPRSPGPHRTLWLLHALGDDHTACTRHTALERHVNGRSLAVVMPRVDRSFYTDMQRGLKYWTFLSDELPRIARSMFQLSEDRADNFVAGLSMGGYGALKLALTHPDRYAAAASLSGALDVAAVCRHHTDYFERHELANIFGSSEAIEGSGNDLFHLAAELAASDPAERPRPRLGLSCGSDDFLLRHSRRFAEHLRDVGLDCEFVEHAGRGHDWAYWDEQLPGLLDSLDGESTGD